jgi:hypothetical protein
VPEITALTTTVAIIGDQPDRQSVKSSPVACSVPLDLRLIREMATMHSFAVTGPR